MSKYVSNLPLCYLVDSIKYLHFASDSDQIISGPSDVGGTCPDNTNLNVSESKDLCCCGSNCCWNDCTLNQPPSNCLPDNTTEWIYSDILGRYQVKRNMIYGDGSLAVTTGKCCITLYSILFEQEFNYSTIS